MAAISHECFVMTYTFFVTACYYRKLPVLPACNANIHVSREINTSLFLLPTLKSGVNIKENTSSGRRDTAADTKLHNQSVLTCWPVPNRLAPLLAHVLGVRGMNFQENPSNGNPDTAEKVQCKTQVNCP
jgi:hypothetical protein